MNLFINYNLNYKKFNFNNNNLWGLGIGDWGLGIGDWAQSPIPNPHLQELLRFNLIIFYL